MSNLIVLLAVAFYFLHLMCENASILMKYAYASNSKFMRGFIVANYFSISSRAFVSLFGLLVSYVIENDGGVVDVYFWSMLTFLFVASSSSYFVSKFNFELTSDGGLIFKRIQDGVCRVALPKVRLHESVFYGVQFVAIGVAYGFSMMMPDYRLTVISLVPVVSMLGTLVSLVVIEPRFANLIDANPLVASGVGAELLRARAISFGFTFFSMLAIYLSVKK